MKKFIAILMVIAMLALSFTVLAENDEREEPTRPAPGYASGTYNGHAYTFDVTQGSSTMLNSVGTYGEEAYLILKFKPTFAYLNAAYGITTITPTNEDVLDFGPHYDDSLTKSYTVAQAASHYTVFISGQQYNLSALISNTTCFSKCVYKYKINGTTISTLTSTY